MPSKIYYLKVSVNLPFLLRIKNSLILPYSTICSEPRIPELQNKKIKIYLSEILFNELNGKMSLPQTNITIYVETKRTISEESINRFIIIDCLKIINNIILSYQASTGSWQNGGYISTLGTSYIQLHAKIETNLAEYQYRYPLRSFSNIPISTRKFKKFKRYLQGDPLPKAKLFYTNAIGLEERGHYSLSYIQTTMSVELELTNYITKQLISHKMSKSYIEKYKIKPLGIKLNYKKGDPRSLETYFGNDPNYQSVYLNIKNILKNNRNKIVHHGHFATREEALQAIAIAKSFFNLVGDDP